MPVIPLIWIPYLVPALLIATRLSGLLVTGPFFGGDGIPARVKAALVVAVTILLVPMASPAVSAQPMVSWLGDGISEFAIGALLGLAMRVVFDAVQLAGQVAGFQLGLAMETAIDPTTQADSTVLATFHNLVVLYVFLELGVHRAILRVLMGSFTTMPIGSTLAALTARQMLEFGGNIFVWGVELVLPVLLATLLIDVTLGFFAKAAPQLPAIFIGIPVKTLCGYAILLAAVRFWPAIFTREFGQALEFFMRTAHAGAGGLL